MTFCRWNRFSISPVLILLIRIGILSVAKLRASKIGSSNPYGFSGIDNSRRRSSKSLHSYNPPYVLYEFAILLGSFIERSKAMREWQDWDENIQGQRPAKPKTDTLASFILLLIIIMICVGGILA